MISAITSSRVISAPLALVKPTSLQYNEVREWRKWIHEVQTYNVRFAMPQCTFCVLYQTLTLLCARFCGWAVRCLGEPQNRPMHTIGLRFGIMRMWAA